LGAAHDPALNLAHPAHFSHDPVDLLQIRRGHARPVDQLLLGVGFGKPIHGGQILRCHSASPVQNAAAGLPGSYASWPACECMQKTLRLMEADRRVLLVRVERLELSRPTTLEPKSSASTNSAILASATPETAFP